MKKLFLVALATFSFLVSLSPAHSQTMDPKVKDQVLRCIRFMIYDEIKVLAHRYLDTASTAPNSIQLGQQKIAELQAQVKSLCGGNDAPNSLYQDRKSVVEGKRGDLGGRRLVVQESLK